MLLRLAARLWQKKENWNKINHASQNVRADPGASRELLTKPTVQLAAPVVGEEYMPQRVRNCITQKCNFAGREEHALDNQKRQGAMTLQGKVTDAGRSTTGWAEPFKEAKCDQSRSIAHVITHKDRRPGPVDDGRHYVADFSSQRSIK